MMLLTTLGQDRARASSLAALTRTFMAYGARLAAQHDGVPRGWRRWRERSIITQDGGKHLIRAVPAKRLEPQPRAPGLTQCKAQEHPSTGIQVQIEGRLMFMAEHRGHGSKN